MVELDGTHDAGADPGSTPVAVIVVQRDHALLELLKDVVHSVGCRAAPAPNARTALDMLDRAPAHVVVVASENRSEILALVGRAPVIAIADSNHAWSAEELGVACLLPLMFDMAQLDDALRQCLTESSHLLVHPAPDCERHVAHE